VHLSHGLHCEIYGRGELFVFGRSWRQYLFVATYDRAFVRTASSDLIDLRARTITETRRQTLFILEQGELVYQFIASMICEVDLGGEFIRGAVSLLLAIKLKDQDVFRNSY